MSEEEQPLEAPLPSVETDAEPIPWKKLNTGIAGTDTQVGANDWDRLSGLLNGDRDVGEVNFNSKVRYYSGKLILKSVDGVYDITFDNPNTLANRRLKVPDMTSDDDMVLSFADQILENKTIDAARNKIFGLRQTASARKSGELTCHSTTEAGSGLLDGHTKLGPDPTRNIDESGTYLRWSTGTTAGTEVGIRTPVTIVRGDFSPLLRIKFRHSTIASDQRMYIGFSEVSALPIGNAPVLTADNAFMFGFTDSDANYQIFRSDGTGTIVQKTDTEIPRDTNFHVLTIEYKYGNIPTVYWKLDSRPRVGYDTDIPVYTEPLNLHAVSQNASAANVAFDIAYVEVESAK